MFGHKWRNASLFGVGPGGRPDYQFDDGTEKWRDLHMVKSGGLDNRKYKIAGDPLQREDLLRNMEGYMPHDRARKLEDAYHRAKETYLGSRNTEKPGVKIGAANEFGRVAAQKAIAAEEQKLDEDFLTDFTQWLRGAGKPEEYAKAQMPGYETKHPNRPLSQHPEVLRYLERHEERKANYYNKLAKMMLNQGRMGPKGSDMTMDQAWKYYKYVVRGLPLDKDGELDFDDKPGPVPPESSLQKAQVEANLLPPKPSSDKSLQPDTRPRSTNNTNMVQSAPPVEQEALEARRLSRLESERKKKEEEDRRKEAKEKKRQDEINRALKAKEELQRQKEEDARTLAKAIAIEVAAVREPAPKRAAQEEIAPPPVKHVEPPAQPIVPARPLTPPPPVAPPPPPVVSVPEKEMKEPRVQSPREEREGSPKKHAANEPGSENDDELDYTLKYMIRRLVESEELPPGYDPKKHKVHIDESALAAQPTIEQVIGMHGDTNAEYYVQGLDEGNVKQLAKDFLMARRILANRVPADAVVHDRQQKLATEISDHLARIVERDRQIHPDLTARSEALTMWGSYQATINPGGAWNAVGADTNTSNIMWRKFWLSLHGYITVDRDLGLPIPSAKLRTLIDNYHKASINAIAAAHASSAPPPSANQEMPVPPEVPITGTFWDKHPGEDEEAWERRLIHLPEHLWRRLPRRITNRVTPNFGHPTTLAMRRLLITHGIQNPKA
jgi:hypothetical protein